VWINLDKTRKNKDIKEDEIYLFYLKSSAKINMDKLSDFFIKNCDLSLFEESEFSKKELINLVLRYIKVEHIKWKHKEENCKMTTTVKKAILNYLKSG